MSASQSELAKVETQLPLVISSSSEDPEEHGGQPSQSLLLRDTCYTKDTVAAAEYHAGGKNENGWQGEDEKPKHVGFWHLELNNVRLHVLKLWARTGKRNRN